VSLLRPPGCGGQAGVREDAVPTNYSITIFGVFGTEQISKYKKNPNYKHQIANGSKLIRHTA
jgi:hypothetical protein